MSATHSKPRSRAEPAVRRALAVLHYGMFGGPHNRFANIHSPLRELGIDLTVVLPDERGDAAPRFLARDVPLIQIPLGRVRALANPAAQLKLAKDFMGDVRRLQGVIESAGAEVVILAGLANPHAAVAADRLGVPVVWQIVDSRVPAPARQLLMRSVRRRSDCTMFWGERLRRMHGGEGLPMPTMLSSSPVDHSRFQFSAAARAAARSEWQVPDDAPLVGSVANLNPQKGIEYLIRAVPHVLREVHDAHFVVVGSRYDTHRDYAARLEREIRELGVAERFRFAGTRTDVEAVLPAFDVKVISSVPASEGIPTTALEAMSVGIPVLTTDVGSAAEAVVDGETGFVVPPLSERALATKIVRLLRDAELRRRLGAAGRRRAVEAFSVERSVEDHLNAFARATEFRLGRK